MSGNAGVMVLFDNPLAELWDVGHINVVLEDQKPIPEGPFVHVDQLGPCGGSQLQSHGCLSNNILLAAIPVSTLNVPEDLNLCSLYGQAFHGLDDEQLWSKEHNVAVVISSGAMPGLWCNEKSKLA
ncbi:hypothetical protein C0993_000804, partial [Termitomyces sp. T159_Od127]